MVTGEEKNARISAATPPEGYVAVDYRKPRKGELFLDTPDGRVVKASRDFQHVSCVIVEEEVEEPVEEALVEVTTCLAVEIVVLGAPITVGEAISIRNTLNELPLDVIAVALADPASLAV